MNMNYVLVIPLLTMILASCDTADRGGVNLTPKPLPPIVQPPPNLENNPVSIISATTKCLAIYEPHFLSTSDGSKVQTVDCVAGSPYQNWFQTQEHEILSANGQCLAPVGNLESGALVALNNCDDSTAQKWMLDEQTATIRHENEFNLCLEMPEQTLQFNGSQLYLMPCHGKTNQQWVIHSLKRKYLVNALNPELLINIEPKTTGGEPHLAATRIIKGWRSAEWTLEPIWTYYRIRNRWKPDRFLHVENGPLEATTISLYWDSAFWTLIRQDNRQGEAYLLRNVWRNNVYIGLDANHELKADTFPELIDGSTLWRIIDVEEDL